MDDQWTSEPDAPKPAAKEGAWTSELDAAPASAAPAAPSAPSAQFASSAPSAPSGPSLASRAAGLIEPQIAQHLWGDVLSAFGETFEESFEGFGGDVGKAYESIDKAYAGKRGPLDAIGHATWQGVILPAVASLDFALRAAPGLYHATQEALITAAGNATGMRDLVSIPDAFMGSPHFPEFAKPAPGTVASVITPIEGAQAVSRSKMAQTGEPLVDSILNSPLTSGAIDNAIIDRSHTVPYTAGGSTPINDLTVYIDHRFPHEIQAPRANADKGSFRLDLVKFDPAEPFVIHENVEQHTMELLTRGGMDDAAAYRVAHYEFAEKAEGAWYRANDIDQDAAEKIYQPIIDRIAAGPQDNLPGNLYEKPYPHDNDHLSNEPDAIDHRPTPEEIAQAHRILAGDPNAPSISGGPGDTLENSLRIARDNGLIGPERPSIAEGTPEEAARAAIPPMTATHGSPYFHDVLTDATGRILGDDETPTSEFSISFNGKTYSGPTRLAASEAAHRGTGVSIDRIFDSAADVASPRDIYNVRIHGERDPAVTNVNEIDHENWDITHKNGESVNRAPIMAAHAGRDAVERALAGGGKGEEPPGGGGQPRGPGGPRETPERSAWRTRYERSVDKRETSDDVKAILKDAVPPDEYPAARRGDISQAQVGELAEASGLSPKEIESNLRGIGRLLRNDDEVRRAYDLLLRLSDGVHEAGRAVAAKNGVNDFDEVLALQKAQMQHAVALEQVVGLRAEWGRTGNAIQEFMQVAKDAKTLSDFNKSKKGDRAPDIDDIRTMAKAIAAGPKRGTPKLLAEARKPGFFDKLYYVWVHGLISGPVTHSKYFMANAGWMAYNTLALKPAAAAIGIGHSFLTDREIQRIYASEIVASLGGLVVGTPNAIVAAMRAIRDNQQGMLPHEVAKGVNAFTGVKNPFQSRLGHAAGEAVGVSGRIVGGIHTLFRTLQYSMTANELAYREAVKEGAKPWTTDFWQRQADHVEFMSDPLKDQVVAAANRAAFTSKLGPKGALLSHAIGNTPFRWLFPFRHLPAIIFRATQEGTPLAFASKEMRDNLLGKNGDVAQHTQWARLVVGSSIMGYVAHRVLSNKATGDGPTDPKARAEWLLDHQPNSIAVGNRWISYNRLGPVGDMMNLGANLAEIAPFIKQGDYEHGAAMGVVAGSRWVTDAVGMQGLANLLEIQQNPERRGALTASFASSFMPFSSAISQTAAALDPDMRDAKNFTDGMKLRIPSDAWGYGRESLPVRRDWLGAPVQNAMEWSLMRNAAIVHDPLFSEMQRLDIWPTLPERVINGVKLGPQAYDRYQVLAGPPLGMALHAMVQLPTWARTPDFFKKIQIMQTIEQYRAVAREAMKKYYPLELIQQPVQNKVNRWKSAAP